MRFANKYLDGARVIARQEHFGPPAPTKQGFKPNATGEQM